MIFYDPVIPAGVFPLTEINATSYAPVNFFKGGSIG